MDLEGAEDVSGLYGIRGTNYLLAGPSSLGLPEGEAVRRGMKDLEAALACCPKGDVGCQATGVHDLGWAHERIGEKKRALEYYEKALPLSRQVGDRSGEATTLNNIGRVYSALGEKKKALEYYEKALPLLRDIGDGWHMAILLANIGSVQADLGNPAEAIPAYQQAAALYLQRNQPPVPADRNEAVGSLGLALQVAIRHKLAQEGQQILTELRRLGLPELGATWLQARLLSSTGAVAAATAAYVRLGQLAAAADPQSKAELDLIVRAGRDRLRQGDLFKGCPGVLATQVLPDSQAQAQGLQPGDVLLRYQGECLGEPEDLIKAVARVPATQEVPLVYVRAGTSATARVRGGKLGVALTAF